MVRDPEFLTTKETAAILRTTAGALHMQRSRRELPGLLGIRMGRQLLFRRADLDKWIDNQVSNQLAELQLS